VRGKVDVSIILVQSVLCVPEIRCPAIKNHSRWSTKLKKLVLNKPFFISVRRHEIKENSRGHHFVICSRNILHIFRFLRHCVLEDLTSLLNYFSVCTHACMYVSVMKLISVGHARVHRSITYFSYVTFIVDLYHVIVFQLKISICELCHIPRLFYHELHFVYYMCLKFM
jgi:hypothetical protein